LGRYCQPPAEASRGSRRDGSALRASPATADPELPSVEGLDTADGLRRVAGNRNLYRKLLRPFSQQHATGPARLPPAFSAGDHPRADRSAHPVKGVAGNLGAGRVQAAAAALEQSIATRGDAAGVEMRRRGLTDELGALIGRLRPLLGEEAAVTASPPVSAVDPAALKALVTEMRKHLSEFDPAVTDLLEDHREPFRFRLGS